MIEMTVNGALTVARGPEGRRSPRATPSGGKIARFGAASSPSTQFPLKPSGCPVNSFLAGIFGLAAFAGVALADDAPVAPTKKPVPEYVPIVVDRAQYEAVMGHLNGMAFKDALPLVKWLTDLEDRAKRQWEADNAPKGEGAAK